MPEILLAEDNAADVYLIREALREHRINCNLRLLSDGKEVLSFLSGQETATAHREELDLIILDLNLPRHDGLEILQRLREHPNLARVPVVVLTSSDSPRDRQMANELGAARFLRKPSNLEQFLALGSIFRELLNDTGCKAEGV